MRSSVQRACSAEAAPLAVRAAHLIRQAVHAAAVLEIRYLRRLYHREAAGLNKKESNHVLASLLAVV